MPAPAYVRVRGRCLYLSALEIALLVALACLIAEASAHSVYSDVFQDRLNGLAALFRSDAPDDRQALDAAFGHMRTWIERIEWGIGIAFILIGGSLTYAMRSWRYGCPAKTSR